MTTIYPVPQQKILNQAVWHINSVSGNDKNTGLLPNKAIKTFGELQARWGIGSVLSPEGGAAEVHLSGNDFPITDPCTMIDMTLAQGCRIDFIADQKVLLTGIAITAVQTKDKKFPGGGKPWAITATLPGGHTWSDYIGKRVEIISGTAVGAAAYVCRDLTGGKAHMTEWQQDGFYGDVPDTTSVFRITDGVGFYIGNMDVSTSANLGTQPDWIPFKGSVNFTNCRIKAEYRFVPPFDQQTSGWAIMLSGNGDNGIGMNYRFEKCFIEPNVSVDCAAVEFAECSIQNLVVLDGGNYFRIFSGGWILGGNPNPQTLSYGSIAANHSTVDISGDVTFVGSNDLGAAADIISLNSDIRCGSISMWECFHGLNLQPGSGRIMLQSDPLLGTPNEVPVWGNDNGTLWYLGQGSKILMGVVTFGPTATTNWTNTGLLPNYVGNFNANPNVPADVNVFMPNGLEFGTFGGDNDTFEALAWDNVTKSWKPDAVLLTWANIDVGVDSGGFRSYLAEEDPSVAIYQSPMQRPNQDTNFIATLAILDF